jgi:hypothetical protein
VFRKCLFSLLKKQHTHTHNKTTQTNKQKQQQQQQQQQQNKQKNWHLIKVAVTPNYSAIFTASLGGGLCSFK